MFNNTRYSTTILKISITLHCFSKSNTSWKYHNFQAILSPFYDMVLQHNQQLTNGQEAMDEACYLQAYTHSLLVSSDIEHLCKAKPMFIMSILILHFNTKMFPLFYSLLFI